MSEPSKKQVVDSRSIEELFKSLPPLDSDSYIEHVRTAPRKELPPEVLVRAYRQLPPSSPGARATLERLFRRIGKRWEYIGVLAWMARQQAEQQRRMTVDDHKDLLQDAIKRILQLLPTERGKLAEQGWNTFCRNEFWDAWRRRYGRRGERLDPVRGDTQNRSDEFREDVTPDQVSDGSLWQSLPKRDPSDFVLLQRKRDQIEAIASQVADGLESPFVQAVARATWFSSQRPKTSGASKPDRDPPLMEQFPGKSRDQINRALRQADSKLAAALLADDNLSWPDHLRKLLEKQKNRGKK